MNRYLTGVVAAIVAVSLLGCGGPEERKAKYLLHAQEYFQEGNYPKARVALRNVLKIDPKDAEAYFLYAQVEEKEKNWRNAVTGYQQVVELNPAHDRAWIKLGKYFLEARAIERVDQAADRVLALHPDHVGARSLKIAALAVGGRVEEAIAQAEQLRTGAPADVDAALLLASLYASRERTADAVPVIRQVLDAHPDSVELLEALAMIHMRAGNPAEADQALQRVIALEPKVLDHRIRRAALLDQQQQYEQAEGVMREAAQLDPDSDDRRLALADYLAQRRGTAEAEVALQKALEDLPRSGKIRFALGSLYERTQQPVKAQSVYEAIRKEFSGKPEGLEAQVKLAGLEWAAGRQDKAERALEQILKDNPLSSGALLLRGKIALQRGNGKAAAQDFRSVLKDAAETAEVHVLLGRAHLLNGDLALARESLEKAAALAPALSEAQIVLVGLDVTGGQLKEARKRLEPLLARDPGNLTFLGLLYQIQMQEKDWDRSHDTLSRLRSAGADRAKVDLAEGQTAAAQQQWDQAEAAFNRALIQQPLAAEPLLALVRLGVQRGAMQQIQTRLETIVAEQPGHPYAAGFLGEVLLMKGETEAAMGRFETATQLNPSWTTPWVHLAQFRYAKRDMAAGDAALKKALEASPDNEQLRVMLATSLEGRDLTNEAMAQYELALKSNPKSLLAANNLAALLVDRKGDAESLQRALLLSRDFESQTSNAYLLDTLGWVHLKLGHRPDALRLLKQALAKEPSHPVLSYHLGVAYAQSGEKAEARQFLSQALQSKQSFPWLDEAKSMLAKIDG